MQLFVSLVCSNHGWSVNVDQTGNFQWKKLCIFIGLVLIKVFYFL